MFFHLGNIKIIVVNTRGLWKCFPLKRGGGYSSLKFGRPWGTEIKIDAIQISASPLTSRLFSLCWSLSLPF